MTADVSHTLQGLEQWTGFEHAVFVQSGSAALKLALDVLIPSGQVVALPALACWTLTGTAIDHGSTINYMDIDSYIGLVPSKVAADVVIAVDPWGSSVDWSALSDTDCPQVLDMTLSILGRAPNTMAADVFDLGVISLGRGKPLDIGAGGILLLRDDHALREAQIHLQYGRAGQQWWRHTARYVFASPLFEVLRARWEEISSQLNERQEARGKWSNRIREWGLPLSVVDARPGYVSGYTRLLPALLAPDYPLKPGDVVAAAVAEGIPLCLQPVAPAYRQPVGQDLSGSCPVAEALSDRLLFLPGTPPNEALLARLEYLLVRLAQFPDEYTRPYVVKARAARVPEKFDHWYSHGVVCRTLDRTYRIYDSLTGKLFAVTEAVVAAIQEKDETITHTDG